MNNIISLRKLVGIVIASALVVGCTPAKQEVVAPAETNQPVIEQPVKTPAQIEAEQKAEQVTAAEQKVMEMGKVIRFGFDDANIRPEDTATLDSWAGYLKASGEKAIIQGHTDERGTREYNIALGERRAKAVIGYLETQGVPASQLEAVSYGEERPAIDASNDYAWSQNRRAVLAD